MELDVSRSVSLLVVDATHQICIFARYELVAVLLKIQRSQDDIVDTAVDVLPNVFFVVQFREADSDRA